ncbi:MAG TPA: penicillin-binding transpeptidase domain-containing protein [Candidatus Nanoarchaeia archaeon]|nr:penicillin-binding transpeptidase domain-containing protein [Candidatus Nanoarchaeia archaeon]
MNKRSAIRFLVVVIVAIFVLTMAAFAATVSSRSVQRYGMKSRSVSENPRTQRKISRLKKSRRAAKSKVARKSRSKSRRASKRRYYYERFYTSSFAADQTEGDITAGEDPVVRQAAVEALGNMNGTVVAIDPATGRVLAMVNQNLALSAGATPCSTIKVPVALAALSEGLITKDTKVALGRRWKMDLTDAMAHSNNAYFEVLGRKLGFEKYSYYAHQYGLGELAGWNIEGEHLGVFPSEPLTAKQGGVGKMCSFGEGISMTPLQLGALMSAIANGGTLYYLQHPRSPEEVANFQPKVKRYLDIKPFLPELADGMVGAVRYGTARSLRWNFSEEQVLGKTGTCSNNAGTRYGWFASFANTQYGRIVTVVFLQGGRPTYGPKAAELAGKFYRSLYDNSFFANRSVTPSQAGEQSAVGAPQ